MKTKRLPPLNSLQAFEAAGRYESFLEAATEQSVTSGSISRHVRVLESYLETELFCRRIGWFKPDGGLKDMMARVTMLAMHRDGLIALPAPQGRQNRPGPIVFGPDTGLSDSLCLGRFSDINETLTEDDGELCLGLGPFTRRAFPSLGRMIEHQI